MAAQKYVDNEADFWKELFVHLQHKNMVRTNAAPLRMAECREQFEAFTASHPDAKISTEYFPSYCIFEVVLTATIKLRLFIQNSIKASMMQKCGPEFIKICDAKFPYNPLPEIDEFLKKLPDYLKELEQSLENKSRSERRQKLAFEFIKAYAATHIPQDKSWKLEPSADGDGTFTFEIFVNNTKLTLTDSDFIQKIKAIS